MKDHLELELVEAIDEGDEIELAQLRVPLQDRAQRRPARLLEMVKEDHRALRQGLNHKLRWR